MEITGKVLREVEFRDRLRGYDTDEVDEFLEEVAVAVDELHRRLAEQPTRVVPSPAVSESRPEPVPEPRTDQGFDDDAIRRTLILAQRTADLAIREANEEAASILESARREANDLVFQANENARRIRQEADEDFSVRIGSQLAQREHLENDVRILGDLVSQERGRIADSLQTVLRYVVDNLVVSPEVTRLAASAPAVSPTPEETRAPEGLFFGVQSEDSEVETEVEAGLDDDFSDAIEEPLVFTEPVPIITPKTMANPKAMAKESDPDEELWKRWAQNDDLDDGEGQSETDPFGFNRRP